MRAVVLSGRGHRAGWRQRCECCTQLPSGFGVRGRCQLANCRGLAKCHRTYTPRRPANTLPLPSDRTKVFEAHLLRINQVRSVFGCFCCCRCLCVGTTTPAAPWPAHSGHAPTPALSAQSPIIYVLWCSCWRARAWDPTVKPGSSANHWTFGAPVGPSLARGSQVGPTDSDSHTTWCQPLLGFRLLAINRALNKCIESHVGG